MSGVYFYLQRLSTNHYFIVSWWDNVYGFDMSTLGKSWRDDAIVDTCSKDQVVTESVQLRDINLQTFTKEDIPFVAEFSLKMKRDDYVNVSMNSIEH